MASAQALAHGVAAHCVTIAHRVPSDAYEAALADLNGYDATARIGRLEAPFRDLLETGPSRIAEG